MAQSLNNLAALYQDQDKYTEAEPLQKRSVAIFEKALGPDHPSVAVILGNYAVLLRAMHREGRRQIWRPVLRQSGLSMPNRIRWSDERKLL